MGPKLTILFPASRTMVLWTGVQLVVILTTSTTSRARPIESAFPVNAYGIYSGNTDLSVIVLKRMYATKCHPSWSSKAVFYHCLLVFE